jgi:hypothetical protein
MCALVGQIAMTPLVDAQNLISNGSFENDRRDPGNSSRPYGTGNPVDGWTVGRTGGIGYVGSAVTTSNGNRSSHLHFSLKRTGSVERVLETVGQSCHVYFGVSMWVWADGSGQRQVNGQASAINGETVIQSSTFTVDGRSKSFPDFG